MTKNRILLISITVKSRLAYVCLLYKNYEVKTKCGTGAMTTAKNEVFVE